MSRPVRVDEALWASAVAPEGVLDRWFFPDGAQVVIGERLAEVQIEGARHDVISPAGGTLRLMAFAGTVVDPGALIGRVVLP